MTKTKRDFSAKFVVKHTKKNIYDQIYKSQNYVLSRQNEDESLADEANKALRDLHGLHAVNYNYKGSGDEKN